jgi:transposase InsO family protein
MKYIALLTNNATDKGKIAYYCRMLKVSRQGFYDYITNLDKPYKYAHLAAKIKEIIAEDIYNDTYGRRRIYEALLFKKEIDKDFAEIEIPSERTVYRIMEHENLVHKPKRKPNGITKADKEAQKSDDLLHRDFTSEKPYEKAVTDVSEVKCEDGKLYGSGIFDCFNSECLALEIRDNMRKELCIETLKTAVLMHPELSKNKAIIHSDRGSQYTSGGKNDPENLGYRDIIAKYGITQSMNSAGGRCHDNAKCESMWARFKEECLYNRIDTEKMKMSDVKVIIWRYFMSYWNNRRICSAIGGIPPIVKRHRYYAAVTVAA